MFLPPLPELDFLTDNTFSHKEPYFECFSSWLPCTREAEKMELEGESCQALKTALGQGGIQPSELELELHTDNWDILLGNSSD